MKSYSLPVAAVLILVGLVVCIGWRTNPALHDRPTSSDGAAEIGEQATTGEATARQPARTTQGPGRMWTCRGEQPLSVAAGRTASFTFSNPDIYISEIKDTNAFFLGTKNATRTQLNEGTYSSVDGTIEVIGDEHSGIEVRIRGTRIVYNCLPLPG